MRVEAPVVQHRAGVRATGLPHGQQATVHRQLVSGVAGFQRLRPGHERDAGLGNPYDGLQDDGAELREGMDVAAAATPESRLPRLVADASGPAMQPRQADLAGAAAGVLEGQGADLPAGEGVMGMHLRGVHEPVGMQEPQHLQLAGGGRHGVEAPGSRHPDAG